MRKLACFSILTGVIVALFAIGCGGGGRDAMPSPLASQAPVTQVTTTVPDIDHLLNSVLAADTIEMAGLTGYQKVPCSPPVYSAKAPPMCPDNEPNGTPLEVFGVVDCDQNVKWVDPAAVPDVYHYALGSNGVDLAGVYAPRPPAVRFDAQYVAVLRTGQRADGTKSGTAIHIHNGRIVALEPDCGDLARLLAPPRVAAWIVQPIAAATQ